ncbi:amino acid racemase [Candidatus Woesearchaeota archaeon]|nr:amino acid racemase [Candidatus Woesearchaeota archaeon]
MKTVGIIGGLGPETTAEFYLDVVFGSLQKDGNKRPPILIWNIPLIMQVERELLEKAIGEEKYLPFLIDAAQRLERGGADFLVLPCNTLHVFIEEIRAAVHIPVLSIVEETTRFLLEQNIHRVGILATTVSLQKKLYETSLSHAGIKQIPPNNFQQAKLGKIIHNLVSGRHSDADRKFLISVVQDFEEKKVFTVILACTDLQLLVPQHKSLQIFDTMKILVDATIRAIHNP